MQHDISSSILVSAMADDEVCSCTLCTLLPKPSTFWHAEQKVTLVWNVQLAGLHQQLTCQVREYKGSCGQDCLPPRDRNLYAACEACIGLFGRVHACAVEKLVLEFGSHSSIDMLQETHLHADALLQEPLSDQSRAPTVKTRDLNNLVVFCPELHGGNARFEPELPTDRCKKEVGAQVASTPLGSDFSSLTHQVQAVSLLCLDSKVGDQLEWASNGSLTPDSFSLREGPSVLFRSLAELDDALSPSSSPWDDETVCETPFYPSSSHFDRIPEAAEISDSRAGSHSPAARSRLSFPRRSRLHCEAQAWDSCDCEVGPSAYADLQSFQRHTPTRTICSISTTTSRCSSVSDSDAAEDDCRGPEIEDESLPLMSQLHMPR